MYHRPVSTPGGAQTVQHSTITDVAQPFSRLLVLQHLTTTTTKRAGATGSLLPVLLGDKARADTVAVTEHRGNLTKLLISSKRHMLNDFLQNVRGLLAATVNPRGALGRAIPAHWANTSTAGSSLDGERNHAARPAHRASQ